MTARRKASAGLVRRGCRGEVLFLIGSAGSSARRGGSPSRGRAGRRRGGGLPRPGAARAGWSVVVSSRRRRSPRARPRRALGAEQPAAELGHLAAADLGGEGAVGGVEEVVALVEDVAQRRPVLAAAERGLDHDQGVVGDDEARGAGAADGVLDEAAAPVRAGGVDALAAAVGEAGDVAPGEQLGDPAGEVAALHVAVAGRERPSGRRGTGRRRRDGMAPLTASSWLSRQR